ncbi:MAG: hypothetical protein ABR609_08760 [Acidimicrobiia bacterium]
MTSTSSPGSADARPQAAYYYPEPFWAIHEGGWIKTLLLFFDQVALLLPEYMRDRPSRADPSLVEPLEDRGLLQILEPEWFVDKELTTQLTEVMVALITAGAFDALPDDEPFAELSMSRAGYHGAHELFEMVFEELASRGLARESQDGVSIPMHWRLRSVYLILLAQLAREAGLRRGFDLHPTTNDPRATGGLASFLTLEPMPSRGHVVAFDLETVTLDLDPLPLDEVLNFRDEHYDEYRAYMANLRSFALELSLLEEPDRARALEDRRAELRDAATQLTNRARRSWKNPKKLAAFGFGLTGAAWTAATGNPIPALIGLGGTLTAMLPDKAAGNAYSYLFSASQRFPYL